jgi:hypothetical protein
VTLLPGEDCHQDVDDLDWVVAARLHVEHGALQHALEAELRRYRVLFARCEPQAVPAGPFEPVFGFSKSTPKLMLNLPSEGELSQQAVNLSPIARISAERSPDTRRWPPG